MVAKQIGRCAICERPLKDDRQVIDHDHATGEVRGVVHNLCNLMLGNSREDIAVLAGGIRYLLKQIRKKPRQEPWQRPLELVAMAEEKP